MCLGRVDISFFRAAIRLTAAPNRRLERTRHGASLLSCVGEPLKRRVILLLVPFEFLIVDSELGQDGYSPTQWNPMRKELMRRFWHCFI